MLGTVGAAAILRRLPAKLQLGAARWALSSAAERSGGELVGGQLAWSSAAPGAAKLSGSVDVAAADAALAAAFAAVDTPISLYDAEPFGAMHPVEMPWDEAPLPPSTAPPGTRLARLGWQTSKADAATADAADRPAAAAAAAAASSGGDAVERRAGARKPRASMQTAPADDSAPRRPPPADAASAAAGALPEPEPATPPPAAWPPPPARDMPAASSSKRAAQPKPSALAPLRFAALAPPQQRALLHEIYGHFRARLIDDGPLRAHAEILGAADLKAEEAAASAGRQGLPARLLTYSAIGALSTARLTAELRLRGMLTPPPPPPPPAAREPSAADAAADGAAVADATDAGAAAAAAAAAEREQLAARLIARVAQEHAAAEAALAPPPRAGAPRAARDNDSLRSNSAPYLRTDAAGALDDEGQRALETLVHIGQLLEAHARLALRGGGGGGGGGGARAGGARAVDDRRVARGASALLPPLAFRGRTIVAETLAEAEEGLREVLESARADPHSLGAELAAAGGAVAGGAGGVGVGADARVVGFDTEWPPVFERGARVAPVMTVTAHTPPVAPVTPVTPVTPVAWCACECYV
jgi:hypothetical protein